MGNHNIVFQNRSYTEIADEIIARLNQTTIVNPDFLNAYIGANNFAPANKWYYVVDEEKYFLQTNFLKYQLI